MSFHDILTKPIQAVKDILDLSDDLESPSVASQFVAIKHQLGEIQARLNESNRISHEKDLEIAKLQRTMAAKAQSRPTAPAFVRHEVKPVQTPPVREPEPAAPVEARQATANRRYAPEQAELDEEIKLPAVPSYQAAAQQARSVRPRAAARTTPSPAPTAAEPRPAKAEKARPTRTRVVARKTCKATPTVAKRTARATKPAATARVKPTRARVAPKKPRTTAESKATPKKSARTSKRATAEKTKPGRARAVAKTNAKTTAKPKRTSRAGKR
jgi:hypothetical protein